MLTTTERVPFHKEQVQSFDLLASVDMYRYDVAYFGEILPETQQRVYDEELTYIAEGMNRPVQTQFNLRQINGELVYFDQGEWRPYVGTLLVGQQVAQQEAAEDPRKQFLADRAAADLMRGYDMLNLKPGDQMAWYSEFPWQAAAYYGTQFIDELGFQSQRRMGFLYLAEREADGSLTLYTQSVDNSNNAAFEAAINLVKRGNVDIDAMRSMYDTWMGWHLGGEFYAGRPKNKTESIENAWELISRHKDLLNYYFEEIEHLALQAHMSRHELEVAKKRLTYGIWAALKERLDTSSVTASYERVPPSREVLSQEVLAAYHRLSARGEVLFGCGGAVEGEKALLGAQTEDVFNAIFGEKEVILPDDKYGSRYFNCPKGHTNTRPHNQLIERCQICKCDVRCK